MMSFKFITNTTEQSPIWEANRSTPYSRNPPNFMKPDGSLPHSQQPATCPYPKPDRSSLRPPSHFSKIHVSIISHLRLGLPSCLLPSGFPTKTLYAPLLSPYVLHALPIPAFLTSSPEWYLARYTKHKAPLYVVFSTPPLPRPSQVQISSWAPCSQKPSAYIPPSISATKFHTHIKTRGKIIVLHTLIFTFLDFKL